MQCRLPKSKEATNVVIKMPTSDVGTIIDDEMRKNATICDMYIYGRWQPWKYSTSGDMYV